MKILAFVLAGGNGTRLAPLTAEHCKPALCFAAGYRIVDFVLSNLVNSQVSPIYVIAQYKPRSLVEHIRTAWTPLSAGGNAAIKTILPATEHEGCPPFMGTADAVYQNIHLIQQHKPDLVAVFAADHVYRMDVRQMADYHQEHGAEVTIAAVPVPLARASSFGILATGPSGELREFQEKPSKPQPIPGDPERAYCSMGNYLFNPEALVELLTEANCKGLVDFGSHIMPALPHRCRAFAYSFAENKVPGVRPYEERGYWRDIGEIDAYRAAQRDVVGPLPRFSIVNEQWPIRGGAYRVRTVVNVRAPQDLPTGRVQSPPPRARAHEWRG
jgi:glucose-1-phosphate adenylyltransferase